MSKFLVFIEYLVTDRNEIQIFDPTTNQSNIRFKQKFSKLFKKIINIKTEQ